MQHDEVFIGLGGNLPHPRLGPPRRVLGAALQALPRHGIAVIGRSRWYASAPVPPSDQPPFLNAVIAVATAHGPQALLDALHGIEEEFGRVRGEPNAARILDLDLLTYGRRVLTGGEGVQLPHPRMHQRAFVLRPLAELAPDWRHPVLATGITNLLAQLPGEQWATPIEDDASCRTPGLQAALTQT